MIHLQLYLGGGEEQRLALGGDAAHDAVDGGGESEVETPVRLVQHQQLQVVDVEGGVLVEVLQQAAWGWSLKRRSIRGFVITVLLVESIY